MRSSLPLKPREYRAGSLWRASKDDWMTDDWKSSCFIFLCLWAYKFYLGCLIVYKIDAIEDSLDASMLFTRFVESRKPVLGRQKKENVGCDLTTRKAGGRIHEEFKRRHWNTTKTLLCSKHGILRSWSGLTIYYLSRLDDITEPLKHKQTIEQRAKTVNRSFSWIDISVQCPLKQ